MRNRIATIASAAAVTAMLAACAAPYPNQPVAAYPTSSYPATYPSGVVSSTPVYQNGVPVYPNGAPVYQSQTNTYPAAGNPGYATEFGRVTNIETLQTATTTSANDNRGTAGTLIGGVVGGLLGNTIGGGSGRAAATVLGAVGGAVVGNKIARNNDGSYATSGSVYRITVQADNGAWRSYEVSSTGDLRVGDRVRMENGVLSRG